MTPKQVLLAHVKERHPQIKTPKNVTIAGLKRAHTREHWRLWCNHFHAGVNTGPDNRPEGWKTGLDVIERT